MWEPKRGRRGGAQWASERAKCSKGERMMRLDCLVSGVRNDLENRDERGGDEEDSGLMGPNQEWGGVRIRDGRVGVSEVCKVKCPPSQCSPSS
jgi:hypothetical protein